MDYGLKAPWSFQSIIQYFAVLQIGWFLKLY